VNPENTAFHAGKYPLLLPKQLGQAHQLDKKNLLLDLLAKMLLPMLLALRMVLEIQLPMPILTVLMLLMLLLGQQSQLLATYLLYLKSPGSWSWLTNE